MNNENNNNDVIRTVGELIDYLSQYDRNTILTANYIRTLGSQIIEDDVERPLLKSCFEKTEYNKLRLGTLYY